MNEFNLMNWLRKHNRTILIVTISGFIISTFVGFGLYARSGNSLADAVAEVNGEKIPYKLYNQLYTRVVNNQREQGHDLNPQALAQIRQEIVQGLIQEEVFYQEALRYGVQVSDMDLANSLAGIPAFQKDGKFDPQTYMQSLHYGLKTTPEDFEGTQKRQIAIHRLRYMVQQSVKVSDKELEMEFGLSIYNLKGKDREKAIKDFQSNPEQTREKIRQEKVSHVLNRWYQQLGTSLNVKVHLDEIEKRLQNQ